MYALFKLSSTYLYIIKLVILIISNALVFGIRLADVRAEGVLTPLKTEFMRFLLHLASDDFSQIDGL